MNPIAEGWLTDPGHHGWEKDPSSGEYFIYSHRWIPRDPVPGHRILCKDRFEFDEEGLIKPVSGRREGT